MLVLEARDRIGGRLLTETHAGISAEHEAAFEVGGQWVSPDQTALIEMIDELGLTTFARYREGESLYVNRQGAALRFTEDLPVSDSTNAAIEELTKKLDALVAETDPDRPWTHPARGLPGQRCLHHLAA